MGSNKINKYKVRAKYIVVKLQNNIAKKKVLKATAKTQITSKETIILHR